MFTPRKKGVYVNVSIFWLYCISQVDYSNPLRAPEASRKTRSPNRTQEVLHWAANPFESTKYKSFMVRHVEPDVCPQWG